MSGLPNTAPRASNGEVVTNEDTEFTFAAADFDFSDTDSGDALTSVKIASLPGTGKGALSLDGTAIAQAALPKTVSKADLDAGELKYTPPADANGTGFASFRFKVNDGDDDSVGNTMTIDVTAVNDAPAASNSEVTASEDTDYAFTVANFNFSDTDSGDALASVKITSLPASGKGTLTLDGAAIALNALPKTVSNADIDSGKLVYTPPTSANGNDYATFRFKVNDGRAESAAYTMTIDVMVVNNEATGAPTISGTATV